MSRGWTHALLLVRPGQRMRDEEGRWTVIGEPVPFRGRAAIRSASRAEVAGGHGEVEMLTVQAPHALIPHKGDSVLVEGLLGRDIRLNGTWLVDAVTSAPTHLRLKCSRTDPA